MPTVQQLPQAVIVNLTDEVMLDQGGTSVAATVAQVLDAQPLGAGIVRSGDTIAADTTVLAPLASPALTGAPTAPTPPPGDNSTRIATTAFVVANPATITLSGDISGSGATAITATLPAVVTPGTYEKVTVDAKGRVVAGGALASADVTGALGYTPLAGNETITLSGDISGSGATAITATLPAVVTPGTYEKVTVDAKGRVVAGGALASADVTGALGYTPLAGNETITLSGDVSGSGATAITATLPAVVTPGTYEKVTVDAKGRVVAGASLAGSDLSTSDVTATGSTTMRTLAARAADRINVLDYGADPTGANASDAAFTAAMNAVPSGTWGCVFVPRGTYKLSGAVNQPSGRSIAVQFDDGANITGPGYLGVDRVESRQGAFRDTQIGGGWFGFAPTFGSAENLAFDIDYINNTPQNSLSMRVGWDRRYTNSNLYGKAHSGIDIAEQRIHSWPNLYDNSSGWGLWEVIEGTTLDEDTAARAGLSTSAEISETDVVNNSHEAGWTWHSGIANGVQGMSIDPWGQNGNYGGHILFAYGSVGSYDGNIGGLNQRWFSYPAVFSAGNPTVAAGTIVINNTTVNVTAGQSLSSVASAINAANIANVRAAVSTWGGVVSRLVIYSTVANDQGTLVLSGTALPSLGIAAATYTTPRGNYAVVIGGSGTVAVGAKFIVQGTTITVGGSGTMADVANAVNAVNLPGIAADTNAEGRLVITAFMPQNASGLTLADVSGQTTLSQLGLGAGTYLPPTPPKGFATAYGDLTSPVCKTTDQISIRATDANGTSYGPVTVTLNGGNGTGWPADVATSISNALQTAGFLSTNFTALSAPPAIVAVKAVGSGGQQGVYIRNTAGGTLTLANVTGTPLQTLGIAPGTYQPGGYSAASQTVFMAAEDSIAPGGRGVFIGGVSNATDLTVYPHTPLEARGGFLHGIRLDNASFNDGNALTLAPSHGIAWGTKAQGQHVLSVASGTLELDGVPVVSSASLDAAFGSEVGDMLVRTSSGWTALTPGAQGQVLTANGPGTPLAWGTAIPNLAAGNVLATSGTPGVAGTITASGILDQLGSTYGDVLYRGASGWVALTPGSTGQFLQSGGPGAPLAWANVSTPLITAYTHAGSYGYTPRTTSTFVRIKLAGGGGGGGAGGVYTSGTAAAGGGGGGGASWREGIFRASDLAGGVIVTVGAGGAGGTTGNGAAGGTTTVTNANGLYLAAFGGGGGAQPASGASSGGGGGAGSWGGGGNANGATGGGTNGGTGGGSNGSLGAGFTGVSGGAGGGGGPAGAAGTIGGFAANGGPGGASGGGVSSTGTAYAGGAGETYCFGNIFAGAAAGAAGGGNGGTPPTWFLGYPSGFSGAGGGGNASGAGGNGSAGVAGGGGGGGGAGTTPGAGGAGGDGFAIFEEW
jgi:hypothetical protein